MIFQALLLLNPPKARIIIRETRAKIINPRLKFPSVLSNKKPKAEGPMAIPRFEEAVNIPKPIHI